MKVAIITRFWRRSTEPICVIRPFMCVPGSTTHAIGPRLVSCMSCFSMSSVLPRTS